MVPEGEMTKEIIMKKQSFILLIGIILSLTGCGKSISQEDYNAQVKAFRELQEDYDAKVIELESIQESYDAQTKELNSTKEKLIETQNEINIVKSELTEMQKELDAINESEIDSETKTTNTESKTEQHTEETDKPASVTENNVESSINSAAKKVFGFSNVESINYNSDTQFVLIKAKGSDNLTNKMVVQGMFKDIFDTLKELEDIENLSIDFNITYPLIDKYGNATEEIVIKASYSNETRQKLNFDNLIFNNIDTAADEWWMHAALEDALQ